jgi:hypothetical protein
MILIAGATGNVGSEVVAALLPAQAGQIRVLTRNPDAVFPDGTQKVVADLADSDLAPVLDGVHAVFLRTEGLNIAAHDHRLVAAARLGSVERIVKLSVLSVGHGATDPVTTFAPRRRGGDPRQRHRVDVPAADRVHVQRAQLGAGDRGRSGRARPVRRWPGRSRRPGGLRSGRRGLPHP